MSLLCLIHQYVKQGIPMQGSEFVITFSALVSCILEEEGFWH